ncbi:hypothetical protein G7Y89_g15141 [Cudoniella acicularis]|uniref:F-box domain-containing protein n=1 Tax=Cudoniella acicularis TaxID=354080 RepID=A0A8H4VP04_9HELO|nr:hypothetical protein G7Y89_g15141 [Cudoniella acicularis]
MGSPLVFCPVCGCPFDVIFDIHPDNVGESNDDIEEGFWASVLPEEKVEWLEKCRLIGRTRCIESFCEDGLHTLRNYSKVEGLFITEPASYIFGEGSFFFLSGSAYRVMHSDENGDVVFPIHNACIEIAEVFCRSWNEESSSGATLLTFYDALCKQYSRNMAAPSGGEFGMYGLEWDHRFYGARDFQDYLDWNGAHGDEWYCADPINIPDLTDFVLSLLPEISSPFIEASDGKSEEVCEVKPKPPPTSKEPHLQDLPMEILHQISSYLPISSVFALRLSSKTLASHLYPDQQFWYKRLLFGTLIPYVWDLNSKDLHAKNAQYTSSKAIQQPDYTDGRWDWKKLAKKLAQKDAIMMADQGTMMNAPIALFEAKMSTDLVARHFSDPSSQQKSTEHDTANAWEHGKPRDVSQDGARPTVSRTWQTERPQPATRASLLMPELTRPTTHVSMLNEAIWRNEGNVPKKKRVRDRAHARGRRGSRGNYSRFNVGNENYNTKGKVSRRDGRLNISVNERNNRGYLAKALGATFLKNLAPGRHELQTTTSHADGRDNPPISRASSETIITSDLPRPKLNIVVMVIGSRGDIQPFLKLGKNLKEYGHRVRIATHPAFKEFVQSDSGLEFFSVGGDPAQLMAFMVKNPGMIPTIDTLKKGEVGRRRDQMAEMFEGFWRACINATDDEKDISNLKMMDAKSPFIADAIIANPPCFAHIHCAECLGVPLHMMFTMPYSPTQAFPHPLANIKKTNVDPGYANFMSYPLVEMMTWQGLGDLINNFRLYRLKVPYTYLWSPGLIPKPSDWGPEIDIAGYVFLDLASSFEPPDDLVQFLDAGEPPVYIGFGSIVVDDPDKFTKMIFEAVEKAGVRALVSKGWGGLGDDKHTPDNIYMLENTPHDWLFPKVQAVVHHGGAGTTAIGLKCGKPTLIVPFFGDQQFWGSMIGKAGAGANPIPYKDLTADKLAEGIQHCLTDEAREAAEKIAKNIEAEGDGAKNAVTSFHRSLVLRGQNSMRCSILEDRVAVWTLKHTNLRLSGLAAELLIQRRKLHWKQLRLIRHNEWNDFEGPGEPITGGVTAIMGNLTGIATGVGSVPFKIAKTAKRRLMHEDRKQKRSKDTQVKQSESGSVTSRNDKEQKSAGNDARDAELAEQLVKDKTTTRGEREDTCGSPMGKHTVQGEPVSQKEEANREANHKAAIEHENDNQSILSDDPESNTAEAMALDVGEGFGKTAESFARIPMDFSLAVAQGFHNAPRLYGDTTVRRPTRITGIKSGLKAAGEEFVFGIYDGFSGLVVQPYTGARDSGPFGFVKGVGMGLTGFVLKDLAAIVGPFGYTLKGVHKELLKGKQPTHFIRKARVLEGSRQLQALDGTETKKAVDAVCHGWSVVQQIWALMDEHRSHGLKGRVRLLRERRTWRVNGAFEDVEMAEKALEARRKGESLESIFKQQREELQLAQNPRKTVLKDMAQGKSPQDDGDAQKVLKNGSAKPAENEKPDR